MGLGVGVRVARDHDLFVGETAEGFHHALRRLLGHEEIFEGGAVGRLFLGALIGEQRALGDAHAARHRGGAAVAHRGVAARRAGRNRADADQHADGRDELCLRHLLVELDEMVAGHVPVSWASTPITSFGVFDCMMTPVLMNTRCESATKALKRGSLMSTISGAAAGHAGRLEDRIEIIAQELLGLGVAHQRQAAARHVGFLGEGRRHGEMGGGGEAHARRHARGARPAAARTPGFGRVRGGSGNASASYQARSSPALWTGLGRAFAVLVPRSPRRIVCEALSSRRISSERTASPPPRGAPTSDDRSGSEYPARRKTALRRQRGAASRSRLRRPRTVTKRPFAPSFGGVQVPASRVSRRSAVDPFIAMDVMSAAVAREATGASVVRMEVGQPSAPAPQAVIAAAQAAVAGGRIGYTEALGLKALRARIAAITASATASTSRRSASSSPPVVGRVQPRFPRRLRRRRPYSACRRRVIPPIANVLSVLGSSPSRSRPRRRPAGASMPGRSRGAHAEAPLAGVLVASPNNPTAP